MQEDRVVTVLCVVTFMSRGSMEVTTDTAIKVNGAGGDEVYEAGGELIRGLRCCTRSTVDESCSSVQCHGSEADWTVWG